MRLAARFLIAAPLALVAVLSGCFPPSGPPTLDEPPPADCATRPPPSVVLGSSNDGSHMIPVDAGLFVHQGIQGGNHVWIAVHTENLGPDVVMGLKVQDATGAVISQDPLYNTYILDQWADPDGGATVFGTGVLAIVDPESIFGKEVTISATVQDACPHSAKASAKGVVQGWDSDQ